MMGIAWHTSPFVPIKVRPIGEISQKQMALWTHCERSQAQTYGSPPKRRFRIAVNPAALSIPNQKISFQERHRHPRSGILHEF